MKTLIRFLALATLLLAPLGAGCGDEDPPPGGDGAPPVDAGGGADSGGGGRDVGQAPAGDGGSLGAITAVACKRLIDACQGEADPLGQRWTAHVVPWSRQACEQIPACFEAQTTAKCFERLYAYYLCLAKVEPFSCQACLNQYQYIMGACPCLHECDPACP